MSFLCFSQITLIFTTFAFLPSQSFSSFSTSRRIRGHPDQFPQLRHPKLLKIPKILQIQKGAFPTTSTAFNASASFRSARLLPSPQVYRCGDDGKEMVVNFVNEKYPEDDISTGECNFRLHIASHDICQIRVDFVDTELMDPVRGECLSQAFTVEGSIWPTGLPPVCGVLNDQHFYLHLEPWVGNASISTVDFKVLTVLRDRPYRFGVWLTQIDCAADNVLKAPVGCTQYFLSEEGSIKSFNYEGYRYLNNQDYQICIQPGRGVCGIRYDSSPGDFGIKKSVQGPKEMLVRSGVGTAACGTDYLLIPEGRDTIMSVREARLLFHRRIPQVAVRTPAVTKKKRPQLSSSQDRYCGGNLSPAGGDNIGKPVFGRVRSNLIFLHFKTSPLQEFKSEIEAMNLTSGFKISYAQLRNCESEDAENEMVSQPPISTLVHSFSLQQNEQQPHHQFPLSREPLSTFASTSDATGTGSANTFPNGSFLTGSSIDRVGELQEDDKIWEYLDSDEEQEDSDLYDYLL